MVWPHSCPASEPIAIQRRIFIFIHSESFFVPVDKHLILLTTFVCELVHPNSSVQRNRCPVFFLARSSHCKSSRWFSKSLRHFLILCIFTSVVLHTNINFRKAHGNLCTFSFVNCKLVQQISCYCVHHFKFERCFILAWIFILSRSKKLCTIVHDIWFMLASFPSRSLVHHFKMQKCKHFTQTAFERTDKVFLNIYKCNINTCT